MTAWTHGTLYGYRDKSCRCPECLRFGHKYEKAKYQKYRQHVLERKLEARRREWILAGRQVVPLPGWPAA